MDTEATMTADEARAILAAVEERLGPGGTELRLRLADRRAVSRALEVCAERYKVGVGEIRGGFRVRTFDSIPIVPDEDAAPLGGEDVEVKRRLTRIAVEAFYGALRAAGFEPLEFVLVRGQPADETEQVGARPAVSSRSGVLVGRLLQEADRRDAIDAATREKAETLARLLVAHLREVDAVNVAELAPLFVLPLASLPADLIARRRRFELLWDGCGIGRDGRLIKAPAGRRVTWPTEDMTSPPEGS